jgi:anti-sigma-K factor RskA
VTEHLADCELCRAELKAFSGVVEDLPMALDMSIPRPELKTRIMNRARQSGHVAQKPASRWQSLWQALQHSAPAWGFASLALVLVLALSNLYFWQRLQQAEGDTRTTMRTVALAGTDFSPGASGRVVISRDGEYGVLVVDGMTKLDESQQYQLWLIKDGQRTSGGVFSVNRRGYGWLYIRSPEPLGSYQGVGITIEPAGGSPGPTGEKVLGGNL